MKILLISNLYPSKEYPFYGTFVKNFQKELEEEGFNFDLAVISGKANSIFDKLKKYIKFFKDVIDLVRKDNFDIIYVHYVSHSLLPLLFVRHLIKKPLVLNAHGSDVLVNSKLSLLIQKLVTPIIKKADLVVVPSLYFKEVVHQKFMIDKCKIFISPSGGVDTEIFRPFQAKKQKDAFTLGFISRIDKGKGWEVILESVNLLKSNNITLLLIGSGSQENQMKDMIKRLGLESVVELYPSQPHDKLSNYFNKMDIFIFPTIRKAESLGLVGIEAMACGVPVVGSNIGGLTSYILDGINGKLFEPANSQELARHIEEFATMNKAELQQYKDKALETGQRYDSTVVANDLAGILLKLKED